MSMHTAPVVQDGEMMAADRAWVGWGVAAAVTGMLAWVIGSALIPIDAKLEKGDQHLAQVLRTHISQEYAAALLGILGAVLLAGLSRPYRQVRLPGCAQGRGRLTPFCAAAAGPDDPRDAGRLRGPG